MYRNLRVTAFLTLALLTLSACEALPGTLTVAEADVSFATPSLLGIAPCAACDQATLAAALTQQKISIDNQSAATAEIMRANAQATLISADATLRAAQTQSQNNANIIAAQIAATSEIERANAQATLYSAASTQSAAQTQSQYDLQVTVAAATQSAVDMLTQQNKNDLAAGTQTAVANTIVTQTQSAAATSQWYTDQDRQRQEERQIPIAFLWMWCLPIFIVLLAGLLLWGFWRWLKIQQTNQSILEKPNAQLPAPSAESVNQHNNALPYIESDVIDSGYQVTKPDDQVREWLDEVKDQLDSSDEKDKENDDTTH